MSSALPRSIADRCQSMIEYRHQNMISRLLINVCVDPNSAPRAGLFAWWRQARALLLLGLFHQLAEMHQMLHVVLADFSFEPEEAKALSLAKGGAAPPLRPLFIGSRPF